MSTFKANFTWANKHVWSKIDRVLHNLDSSVLFEFAYAELLMASLFNHAPAFRSFALCPKEASPFRFCDMWVNDDSFGRIV